MKYCECETCQHRRECFELWIENSHAPVWSDLYGYEVKDAVACSKCGILKLNPGFEGQGSGQCRACRYLHIPTPYDDETYAAYWDNL